MTMIWAWCNSGKLKILNVANVLMNSLVTSFSVLIKPLDKSVHIDMNSYTHFWHYDNLCPVGSDCETKLWIDFDPSRRQKGGYMFQFKYCHLCKVSMWKIEVKASHIKDNNNITIAQQLFVVQNSTNKWLCVRMLYVCIAYFTLELQVGWPTSC